MELVSDRGEAGAVAAKDGGSGAGQKSIETYFEEFYCERVKDREPDGKDRELFRFAAERARAGETAERRNESLEKDAADLLEFILGQEV